jgi:hypothetical protein
LKLSAVGEDGKPLTPLSTQVLISHPQTSRLTDSVLVGGGRIGVRRRGDRAPTTQAGTGRVTDSDGGGRMRVGG